MDFWLSENGFGTCILVLNPYILLGTIIDVYLLSYLLVYGADLLDRWDLRKEDLQSLLLGQLLLHRLLLL